MLIESTIHIHKSILEKLDTGAEMSRRSRISVIKLLIQRIMKDNKRMIKTYSRIKYQERDVRENWSRVNIVFNEYEYEYCQDLRKFFKMSISLILAYAVRRYLDEILNDLLNGNKSTDNCYDVTPGHCTTHQLSGI
jgi:hypothetical protein